MRFLVFVGALVTLLLLSIIGSVLSVSQNTHKVDQLVSPAIAKSKIDPTQASINKAESLFLLGNHDDAFEALLPLAMQGHASAQFYLAEWYQVNKVGLDESQAIYWYQKAANQGNPNAQYNLANAYYAGDGVLKDLDKALSWYKRAAKKGVPEAQLNLGYMYSKGKGVQQDDELASLWYEAAAKRGNTKAQSNLGFRYCEGFGVEKSLGLCAFWVKKAMDKGNPNAKKIWRFFDLEQHVGGAEKTSIAPELLETK